jgi:phosphoenolpyruvate-protein kinase (PTS system EI component)
MSEVLLSGLAVSVGVAVGPAFPLAEPVDAEGPDDLDAALAALARVAQELARTAERLRAQGRGTQAEIIEANRLMAEDPTLAADVTELAARRSASAALRIATDRRADALAALDDPLLAARAADVRELGRRAVRALGGAGAPEPPPQPSIVVARDLGPAELVDLRLEEGFVLGIALAEGSATSHAAIIARSLGVPMVADAGRELLDVDAGDEVIVDGTTGTAVARPGADTLARFRAAAASDAQERARLAAGRGRPAVTADGREIRLLANASTPAEAAAALDCAAEGLGLVRTELAFLDAYDWPTEEQHREALEPTLSVFNGRVVTVRTLDFGADKTPPFLRGRGGRGVELTLEHEEALEAQFAGILRAAANAKLRIMLPLVESPVHVVAARRVLRRAAITARRPMPPLGAMIETPTAALRSHELALVSDFFSIGTNDLVATTLGLDREEGAASPLTAGEPAVVRLMRRTVESAHAAGITVEVCGEAAGEPSLTSLLVGLGVDELSVSPSRLDAVREAIRASGEGGDELSQLRDGGGGVVA